MNQQGRKDQQQATGIRHGLSRRALLRQTTAASLALLGGTELVAPAEGAPLPRSAPAGDAELRPIEPIPAIFAAMHRYPLVANCERHMLQE